MNLIKAHGEKGSGPFSFERIGHLSSPSRSCLGRLILHPWWTGAALKLPDIGVQMMVSKTYLKLKTEKEMCWLKSQESPWTELVLNTPGLKNLNKICSPSLPSPTVNLPLTLSSHCKPAFSIGWNMTRNIYSTPSFLFQDPKGTPFVFTSNIPQKESHHISFGH